MNVKVIISLLAVGILSDIIDGIVYQIYSFKNGFRIWDISTWSSAPSYFEYFKTFHGCLLTILAIAPWIILIAWLQLEEYKIKKEFQDL